MLRTAHFHCQGHSIPVDGTKILQAASVAKNKCKKTSNNLKNFYCVSSGCHNLTPHNLEHEKDPSPMMNA